MFSRKLTNKRPTVGVTLFEPSKEGLRSFVRREFVVGGVALEAKRQAVEGFKPNGLVGAGDDVVGVYMALVTADLARIVISSAD